MQSGFDFEFLFETFFTALSGVPITLLITGVALLLSLPFGFLLALSRIYRVPVISQFTGIYVSFIRGTPIIVQIFIIYTSLPMAIEPILVNMGSTLSIYDLNPIWYAFVVFSINTTAVMTEVFRSALLSLQQGQLEAAWASGLTTSQSYRRILIPQALAVALPNLCSATTNLIKATSLGYAMSLGEITLRAKVAANVGYNYMEAYIDIFLVYLILCSLVEFGFKRYERRLNLFKNRAAKLSIQ